jgi:diguanylate cyclase (GGDEF)-like protein/PAS domain S-box-containing protein
VDSNNVRQLRDPKAQADSLLLRTLLGQLDGMVYRCRDDEHWTMEFVSEGCMPLTGYRPEELLLNSRVSYEEITHAEDRARVREAIRRALEARQGFDVEYRILRADGETRWVWERGAGLFAPDDTLQAVQGFIQDITERRGHEQALEEAERRYRGIFENAVEGIFQTAPDGHYLRANPALARIYGYGSPEALIAKLRDIGAELYVDAGRRDEFVRLMREHGQVRAFESQVRKADDTVIWISESAREVRDAAGRLLFYEGTVEDITVRKAYEMRIAHQATHDMLTGLPNRVLLADRIAQAVQHAARDGEHVAVAFLDLDNFKFVNDSLGHEAGDELIRTAARRLKSCLRESDTVARLGGDEFVLLLPRLEEGDARLIHAVQRVLAAMAEPCAIGPRELAMSCSIGVAVYPAHGRDTETLLRNADAAMYHAKQSGRNNFKFYSGDLKRFQIDRLAIEAQLRRALEERQFELHYQPQVLLGPGSSEGRFSGCEALIRWRTPDGLVSPARFIPLAEDTGLIEPIGDWVLRSACEQIRDWAPLRAMPRVSVNVSPRQFRQPQLARRIEAILAETGVAPGMIELEITESCLAHDSRRFLRTLENLKDLGVGLALDDFGAGYSSLAYLRTIPIDRLKIDRTFVADLETDGKGRAIVMAIAALGRNLGIKVLAEGVETLQQYQFLRSIGCDEIQGYYSSMPLPAAAFAELLARHA